MTAEKPKSPRAPARPRKLLAALMAAQAEAVEVPATSSTRRTDGHIEETTAYAASDDSLRVARRVLHQHGLMALPGGTKAKIGEHGKVLLTVVVTLVHVESGQELERTFEVSESTQYGSNAAALSAFATALRLLLCLPRAPEATTVAAVEAGPPEPPTPTRVTHELPPEEPRPTHRVTFPAPRLAERVAERVHAEPPADVEQRIDDADAEELRALCQTLGTQLAERESTRSEHARDPEAWKCAAGVPGRGRLSRDQLQRYARWLARELAQPPDESGAAWPREAG